MLAIWVYQRKAMKYLSIEMLNKERKKLYAEVAKIYSKDASAT